MKRMRVLFGQRRVMVLVTLTILVLAAAALAASSASFTATSANPGNEFTAGDLDIGNYLADGTTDNEGGVIASLPMTNMAPGDSSSGTAVIVNEGSVSGDFTLTPSYTGSALLAGQLQLTVTMDGTSIYTGSLADFAIEDLGSWDGAERHTFVFNAVFPAASGDSFQGLSATATFTWDAVSN
jgi:spore coat-associated protein N